MTAGDSGWRRPRRVCVVVDNPSWVLPYAEEVVATAADGGDQAVLVRDYSAIPEGDVAFFLGCLSIAGPDVLARNRFNLVVHASDLPKGRGFSPLTWQVLEGKSRIPVCLLAAAEAADAGEVFYRDEFRLAGTELLHEMHVLLGGMSRDLCLRFLAESQPPRGTLQEGEPSWYPRRRPADSRLDPARSIAEQFDLLRVVDNVKYPAWFELRGRRYRLAIEPLDGEGS